jgi:hypothetical protein
MKYISAQPATQYFGWQIDIMLYSFRTVGVNLEDVHVLCLIQGQIDIYFDTLMKKYPGVLFNFYEDTRGYKEYIPSVKQHLLHKHYLAFPELENETVFLTDSDICLTSPVNFNGLLDDNIWYLSDTISYMGYDYIASKGDDILNPMLEVAGISKDVVRSMQGASGGAQYLFKNVKASYWQEVVEMSHNLYKKMLVVSSEKEQRDKDYFPLQIWTCEMWALLWVAWKKGQMTAVSKNLDFCWATDPIDKWSKTSIFHNAGVTVEMKDLFFKGAHIDEIPPLDLTVSSDKCSYMYYKVLQQALV